jgi:hypothetical protein
MFYLISDYLSPDIWVVNGGAVCAMFVISDHLVVIAPTRVHLEIELMLAGVRNALTAELVRWEPPYDDYRAFSPVDVGAVGLLDGFRIARAIEARTLREHDVTDENLDTFQREVFGLLDTIRAAD